MHNRKLSPQIWGILKTRIEKVITVQGLLQWYVQILITLYNKLWCDFFFIIIIIIYKEVGILLYISKHNWSSSIYSKFQDQC